MSDCTNDPYAYLLVHFLEDPDGYARTHLSGRVGRRQSPSLDSAQRRATGTDIGYRYYRCARSAYHPQSANRHVVYHRDRFARIRR